MKPRPPAFPMNRAPASRLGDAVGEFVRCLVGPATVRLADAEWAASLSAMTFDDFEDLLRRSYALARVARRGKGPDDWLCPGKARARSRDGKNRRLAVDIHAAAPWFASLGKVPDNQIALESGLTRVTIGKLRKQLGLPPAPLSTHKKRSRPGGRGTR